MVLLKEQASDLWRSRHTVVECLSLAEDRPDQCDQSCTARCVCVKKLSEAQGPGLKIKQIKDGAVSDPWDVALEGWKAQTFILKKLIKHCLSASGGESAHSGIIRERQSSDRVSVGKMTTVNATRNTQRPPGNDHTLTTRPVPAKQQLQNAPTSKIGEHLWRFRQLSWW